MLEVSFVYLAYEGTQFGAEKMVLFSQRKFIFQAKGCQWPAEMSPLSSEHHRVVFSRFGGLRKLNVTYRFIWIPMILGWETQLVAAIHKSLFLTFFLF